MTNLPTAPVAVSGAADANTATISWQPPADTGGLPVTGYRVSRDGTDTGNTGAYSTVVTAATRTSSMRFLLVGATYSLSVQALLSDGSVAPVARGSVRIH